MLNDIKHKESGVVFQHYDELKRKLLQIKKIKIQLKEFSDFSANFYY